MSYRKGLRTGVGVAIRFCLLLAITASLARAQGVTGTVSGSVKDAQGAVFPGATVILLSQSRGTHPVPVIAGGRGDFVFPNLTADTYTIQVEMPSFKTLRRSGLILSPGSTVAVGAPTIEIRGAPGVRTVKGETPLVQTATGEKSFSIDPAMSAALPLNNRSYLALLVLAPGVNVDPNSLASQMPPRSPNTNPPPS